MLVYPDPPDVPGCVLLFVPVELVPIVGGAFKRLEARRLWASESDWEQGYRAVVELEAQLMDNCLDSLIAEIRAFRGVRPEYAATPEDERTIDMYRDLGDVAAHLNAIVFALRGLEEPDDSILEALRGIVPAGEDRNVIDQLI